MLNNLPCFILFLYLVSSHLTVEFSCSLQINNEYWSLVVYGLHYNNVYRVREHCTSDVLPDSSGLLSAVSLQSSPKMLETPMYIPCDCKVTWLQQHHKREGETKGSKIFQSVSSYFSKSVACFCCKVPHRLPKVFTFQQRNKLNS